MLDFKSLPPRMKQRPLKLRKGHHSTSDIKAAKQKRRTSELEEKLLKEQQKLRELEDLRDSKAKGILSSEQIDQLSKNEADKVKSKIVIFKPNPGPQTDFLQANEDEVLFAGGRGSGKSDALIVDPLRYCDNKNFRALVIRKTMPELKDLMDRAKDIYPQAYPGVRWRQQDKLFIFPSGAKVEFGYLETDSDVERYRGQQYTWIGVDELTLFPREETIDRLMASARTTDPTLKIYKRYSTNPNGPGRSWVKRRFVDKAPPNTRFNDYLDTSLGQMCITRRWINSKPEDNPVLIENNPQYLGWLASLPDTLRKAWLHGDWNVAEGIAFPDFNATIHVIKAFEVPKNWLRFRACDWGFTSMAVCLWFAVDEDSNIYVYREYKTKLVTADIFAGNVLQLEREDKVRYGVIDGSVGDQRGITGPTVDEQMRMVGCHWRYADKTPGSRIAGKNLIHRYLAIEPHTGRPKLKIMENCKELIEELSSLPTDKNNVEDVDTDCDDHAYDTLRYGIMSRPNIVSSFDGWYSSNANPRPVVVDTQFGY